VINMSLKANTTNNEQIGLQGRAGTGKLQTLWFAIPRFCNLGCSYCYADGGTENSEDIDQLLTRNEYEDLLTQAKAAGVDLVGIPGAGEPFIGKNRQLTMWLLEKCAELDLYCTVFTTAEFIDEELADTLFELPVELMIKCNALDPEKQDRFVSDPGFGKIIHGYGAKRNAAIHLLIRNMFNKGTRLSLVTPIMSSYGDGLSNVSDLEHILRFCRKHNLIPDIDTILQRGRGDGCTLTADDSEVKQAFANLQRIDSEEFDRHWDITSTYFNGSCNRCDHHLSVSNQGDISPCIGSTWIKLGNIRTTSLEDAWNSPERRIIRSRRITGACVECKINNTSKCHYPCLGRWVEPVSNAQLVEDGAVRTLGCWNFR
jgi:MoaA/NifB/PqqE/SkfB family radical SAM enzyme